MAKTTKKIRTITVNADKCNGCRTCEIMCSAFHAVPPWSSNNPARSRIQIITNRLEDIWMPVFAGDYTESECTGRNKYIMDGKEYSECDSCRSSCPARDLFKEPDSGLPLKCDMCDGEEMPICVKWCLVDALIYEEREEDVEEKDVAEVQTEMKIGLESLIKKHGYATVMDTIARMKK